MRIVRFVTLSTLLLALTPAISHAQDDKKLHFNIGGGPTFISGDLGDHFGMGWGPAVGVTFDVKPRIGLQFEYAYRYFDISDNAPIPAATTFSANHQTHQLDFNFVATLTKPDAPVRAYVTVGPGAYYRKVEITQYQGTGVICDPYWYVCGSYPIEAVLGSRGGWDPGFNIGAGVGFKIGESSEFTIESRFHYVSGPDIQPTVTPLGTTLNGGTTNGYYLPLTFGFRF